MPLSSHRTAFASCMSATAVVHVTKYQFCKHWGRGGGTRSRQQHFLEDRTRTQLLNANTNVGWSSNAAQERTNARTRYNKWTCTRLSHTIQNENYCQPDTLSWPTPWKNKYKLPNSIASHIEIGWVEKLSQCLIHSYGISCALWLERRSVEKFRLREIMVQF